jgi:hypothetical protein
MTDEKPKRKKTYSPKPSAAPSVLSRLDVILRVQTGELTVTAGAKALGVSRGNRPAIDPWRDQLMPRILSAFVEEAAWRHGGQSMKHAAS